MNERFKKFCEDFSRLLGEAGDTEAVIAAGRETVGALAADTEWFRAVAEEALVDGTLLGGKRPSLWPNEISLYREPDGEFLVFLYLWDGETRDAIHDHGAWGIVSTCAGVIREVKYRRRDDGSREGYADLEKTAENILKPGDTTFVLPGDEGIHCMINDETHPAVTVNVYGRPRRRGFVRFFDAEKKRVYRVYPPRATKEVLLVRALAALGDERSRRVLERAALMDMPAYLREEYDKALRRS
ncbi:MAG TPA: cysteine dioxygenase family protein [Syntrophales bacterium]|nr:cysteine dioxygenase family protein [Syntrophales bacterium]HPQ07327.1 cysteine dioxygenase family protein [Syntrophales bacterium]HRS87736.1 cysteine dioxygenase family protein [Syntrophales bacterium]HRV42591.1 cysteine dioxygenase family protein [Syntrophales bacterium]